MTSIDNFLKIRSYTRAYSIWLQLTKNNEIYHLYISLFSPELEQKIQQFRESIPSLHSRILVQLSDWIEKGIDYYEKNDIEQAFFFFTRAAKIKTILRMNWNWRRINPAYIRILRRYCKLCRQLALYEMGDWTKVLDLYSHITHESQWLKVHRKELKQRQEAK